MRRPVGLFTSVCALALTAGAISLPAFAQATSGGSAETMETVLVTASKLGAQSLQATPLAIQAFTGENLKVKNVVDVGTLMSSIPGAAPGQDNSNSARSYTIRGVGTSTSTNGDSPIGYYLDDVPFNVPNFGIAPPIRFLDIERVEVLRGPQGTLYGQGSAGGTMIFHSRQPDLQKYQVGGEASISSTTGAHEINYDVSGFVSVPIVDDKLALRVSGGVSYNAGYTDVYFGPDEPATVTGHPDQKDANYSHNQDLRAVLLWKPIDKLSVTAQFWQFRPTQEYASYGRSLDPSYMINTGGVRGYSTSNFRLYSLTTDVDFGFASVTNIASYVDGNFGYQYPIGGGGIFSSFFFPTNFSEEIRIHSSGGPLHWLVGGAYQDGEGPQKNTLKTPVVELHPDNNSKATNGAIFGEVSYDLLDGKLVPLAGLRLYTERRAYADSTTEIPVNRDVLTWRFNLSYLPTEDLTLFATAATGFRPGMIQSKLQADAVSDVGVPSNVSLNPETLTNYELGVKWITFDGQLSIAANLYRINMKGLITNIATNIENVNGYANFGNAYSDGVDLELNWHTPIKGLSFGFIGNLNDGQFDSVNPYAQTKLTYIHPGARLVNGIRNNWQVSANYARSISDSLEAFGNFSWNQYGNRLMSSGILVPEYGVANATAGLRYDTWELALVVSNLGDERGPSSVFSTTSFVGVTPRTVGIRLRKTTE